MRWPIALRIARSRAPGTAIAASGLDHHGLRGDPPLPFTHLDVGGSATEGGDWAFGRPTAASLTTLARLSESRPNLHALPSRVIVPEGRS